MQNNDIIADRRPDGSYVIRRWRASDGRLVPIEGHEDFYDEEEVYRRLNILRRTGDTYIREAPAEPRLIHP